MDPQLQFLVATRHTGVEGVAVRTLVVKLDALDCLKEPLD
jgi:hypothetical protein